MIASQMTGANGQRREAARRLWARCPPAVATVFALVLVVAGLLVTGARPAVGGEPHGKRAEAKMEFEKAQLHYRLGRFEEALKAYTRAYELFNAPALLFNIGQCHKNLQNYERALFFFEGYLREETNPEKRALAEELIAASRAAMERQRIEAARTDPLAPTATPPSTAGPGATGVPLTPPPTRDVGGAPAPASAPLPAASDPGTTPVLVTTRPEGEPPADERPVYKKWWFWTALGVGAAAVATGAAIYYATGPTTTVRPSGTVGTLDRR
jgi:hypothetical protein